MPDRRWWQLPRTAQVALVAVLALAVAVLSVLAERRVAAPVPGAGTVPRAAATSTPSAAAAPTPTPTPTPPSGPVPVVLVGDAVQDPAAAAPDWTALTVQGLQASGRQVAPVVAAAGGAGYVARGASGEVFSELVARTVTPTTRVVVLLGSRNDLGAVGEVGDAARVTYTAVRQSAPGAALVVVAPVPVPGDAPDRLTGVRDVLRDAAAASGATFVDPLAEGWALPPGTATSSRSRGLRLTPAGGAYVAGRLVPHLLPVVPATVPAATVPAATVPAATVPAATVPAAPAPG